MKKSQSSLEFALIVTFMFTVLVVFFSASTQRMIEIQIENDRALLEDLGTFIQNEIGLATVAADGYMRVFEVPRTLSGREYNITIYEFTGTNLNHSEIVISYVNYTIDYEYILPLSLNVSGSIDQNVNTNVTIRKKDNNVLVN